MTDNVNHPPHYTQGAVECIDAIESALGREGAINYCRGAVLKYAWRCKDKGGAEDMRKAAWYANKAAELMTPPESEKSGRGDDQVDALAWALRQKSRVNLKPAPPWPFSTEEVRHCSEDLQREMELARIRQMAHIREREKGQRQSEAQDLIAQANAHRDRLLQSLFGDNTT